jgi:hypothetical protein
MNGIDNFEQQNSDNIRAVLHKSIWDNQNQIQIHPRSFLCITHDMLTDRGIKHFYPVISSFTEGTSASTCTQLQLVACHGDWS